MLWIEHLTIGRFLLVPATSRPTKKKRKKVVHLLLEGIPHQKRENLVGMRNPQAQRRRTPGPNDSGDKDHPQGRLFVCVWGIPGTPCPHTCLMELRKKM